MKTNFTRLWLAGAFLAVKICAMAQPLNTIAQFNGGNGANPQAPVVVSGNMLYGTTYSGGASNAGTVFAVNLSNSNLSTIYSFTGGSDGGEPAAGLVLSGNVLYGTASSGGAYGNGTVFAVNTSSNGFTNVYSFTGGYDGAAPQAGLVLMSNTLYGTAFIGGAAGYGTVFSVTTNGTNFISLHSFTGSTNGSNPEGVLVLAGTTLYGTTYGPYYSGSGYGTIFAVNINSNGFTNLYSFKGSSDGANPEAGLLLVGGALYGTASAGGTFGDGTVFQVNTNAGGFQSYLFNYTDGANPQSGLILLGSTLYGTTANGGASGYGTVFSISTNGGGLTNIYSFTDGADGANPEAALASSGTTLYGTTQADNGYGPGTVFSITAPPPTVSLNIALQSGQVTLTWSNPAFSLQSAPAVNGTYTNVPGATSPFTNAITNHQQFFRLRDN